DVPAPSTLLLFVLVGLGFRAFTALRNEAS
ncbi:MAG: hypothetical protein ACI8VI_001801, partial [Granulosicoccus sp.]